MAITVDSPSAQFYIANGDDERTVTVVLVVDGQPYDLSDTTIVCQMQNLATEAITTVTDVTADPDQLTNKGRCVTEFTAAQLAVANSALRWRITDGTTIITCPGDPDRRAVLYVSA